MRQQQKQSNEMRSSLTRHVAEVCQLAYSRLALQGTPNIHVVDCTKERIPAALEAITAPHEFLVMLECPSPQHPIDQLRAKLSTTFGKVTYMVKADRNEWLCWFEGAPLERSPAHEEGTATGAPHHDAREGVPITHPKTHTALPNWLDSLLYEKMSATYNPDYEKFADNLELSEKDLRVYLGTYFPRSYAEVFCICDNLFEHPVIGQSICALQDLTVLDIGCGTGGDLLGLLVAISKHFTHIRSVNVTAVDGHQGALKLLAEPIAAFQRHTRNRVNLNTLHVRLDKSAKDLHGIPEHVDFVLSCKVCNEVIQRGRGKHDDAYLDMLVRFAPRLAPHGVFLLLDVTTKADHTQHYPFLLNRQVGQFVRNHPAYRTLLPLPCSYHEQSCREGCFSQRHFAVSCKGKGRIPTRVAYRIIGRSPFIEQINGTTTRLGYTFPAPEGENTKPRICHLSAQHGALADAYTLCTSN